MRLYLIKILFFFGILLICTSVRAQYSPELFDNVLSTYEKVFVHIDRKVYVTGGELRYRIFMVDAALQPRTAGSTVLYFELQGLPQDSPVRWRVNLNHGNGAGLFNIPANLESGVYQLRAFTSFMRNGDPEYVFSTEIMILNISEENTQEVFVSQGQSIEDELIRFYPESGGIITGIENQIGYKLNDIYLSSPPDSIFIFENDSVVVGSFVPDAAGFGSFYLTPRNGSDYHAGLLFGNRRLVLYQLPAVETWGYKIRFEEATAGLIVRIISQNPPGADRSRLQLVAISRGEVVLDTMVNDGNRTLVIPANQLSKGILGFTLFDSRRFTLFERLYYYEGESEPPSVQVLNLQPTYGQNENIDLRLSVDGISEDDIASLAVSVAIVHPFDQLMHNPSIEQYFHLSSEVTNLPLKTLPSNIIPSRIQELLLMADSEDYAWNYLNRNIQMDCSYELENHGYVIKGRVFSRSEREPLADAHLLLSSADSITPGLTYTKTDEEGRFFAVLNAYYDNREIFLQVIDRNNNSGWIWEIEEVMLPENEANTLEYFFTGVEKEFVDQTKNIRIIDEVYKLRPSQQLPDESTIRNGFLQPNEVIYPADFTELVNFKEIADNILPTVRFVTRNSQYVSEVFNRYLGMWFENRMILLNGVLFKDLSYIATLGSKDIERIEVYNSNIMCGEYTFPGLIAIYTMDGQIPDTYRENYTYSIYNEVIPENHAMIRQPGGDSPTGSEYPDFRQTLYWNPYLSISMDEEIPVSMNTSLLQGTYEINIQGMTTRGIPLSKTLIFDVE